MMDTGEYINWQDYVHLLLDRCNVAIDNLREKIIECGGDDDILLAELDMIEDPCLSLEYFAEDGDKVKLDNEQIIDGKNFNFKYYSRKLFPLSDDILELLEQTEELIDSLCEGEDHHPMMGEKCF